MTTAPLTLDVLNTALDERDAAFRVRTRLQPAGGPGEKIFPPTYAVSGGSPYAFEDRRIDGQEVRCVLLDSVASQANRMEEALRRAWEEDGFPLPVIYVDFKDEGLIGLHELTVLDAPHRIADALLRDSFLADKPFRYTEPGEALTKASARDATDLFHWSPTSLVFGVWDSTGPRGGLGVKFARALASEIVGIGAVPGVKTASRIDPAGIEIKAATLCQAKAGPDQEPGGWVLDESQALKDKTGKPVPVAGGGDTGKPSAVNHGNVAPTIDRDAGGVTIDYALQTTVLSMTALRRLRFPRAVGGQVFSTEDRPAAERAARAALAALGLAAVALAREDGYFLRSRCHLVPEEAELGFERVGHDGSVRGIYTLGTAAVRELVTQATKAAEAHGLPWRTEPVVLKPAKKLVTLIRKSQEIARVEA